MKLSIWSAYYYELSPEDMILEFEKHGIHYVELADEHATMLLKRGNPSEIGKEFGNFARAHGVEISQGHLWIAAQICNDTETKVKILGDWLDLFEAIGIKAAVLHLDLMRYLPNVISTEEIINLNVEAVKLLCRHIEGRDIKLSLENISKTEINNAKMLIHIIELVGSDRLGICLDTGHLNLIDDCDQEKFILDSGKYLNALHINDNDKSTDQHMIPFGNSFGKNCINWEAVMRSLKKIGYDGLFNYEIPGEIICPAKIKSEKIEYIKKVHEYLESII